MLEPNEAADGPPPPTPADLMAVFETEDVAARLDVIRDRILPALREEMAACNELLAQVYGDAWLDLVTPTTHPSTNVTPDTAMAVAEANVGFVAKRKRDRPYRKFTGQGKRAMILDLRACTAVTSATYGSYARINGLPEVRLFGEVWNAYRDETLALLESTTAGVWSKPPFPGPPEIPIGQQLDLILRSDADYVCLFATQAGPDWSGPSASWAGKWGALCLWPIFIGVIEAALDRQPSVRAFHRRLCEWLSAQTDDDDVELADEKVPSRTRYLVFRRDQFRCVMCGATAAEGAKLEADHILPKSKGGTGALANLQTLCDRCNRGKGSDISPDLRATTPARKH